MRRDRPRGHLVDRFWRATINTWNGLLAAARSEAAFREELVVMAVAVPLSFVVAVGVWHRVVLIAVVLLVLLVELLNTGLEKLADAITTAPDGHRSDQGYGLRRRRGGAPDRRHYVARRHRRTHRDLVRV